MKCAELGSYITQLKGPVHYICLSLSCFGTEDAPLLNYLTATLIVVCGDDFLRQLDTLCLRNMLFISLEIIFSWTYLKFWSIVAGSLTNLMWSSDELYYFVFRGIRSGLMK